MATNQIQQFRLNSYGCYSRNIMHQSFVTTAPPPTEKSGDDFSSIKALLKALHCGDLLRVIAPLFIIVNSMGAYFRNITNKIQKLSSFKSNENIHKREDGSYYVVSAKKASSVTL